MTTTLRWFKILLKIRFKIILKLQLNQLFGAKKHVEIDQAEESVTDDDDDDSLSHLIISHEQKELNKFVVKSCNNVSMDLFGNSDPKNTNQYEFDLSLIKI